MLPECGVLNIVSRDKVKIIVLWNIVRPIPDTMSNCRHNQRYSTAFTTKLFAWIVMEKTSYGKHLSVLVTEKYYRLRRCPGGKLFPKMCSLPPRTSELEPTISGSGLPTTVISFLG